MLRCAVVQRESLCNHMVIYCHCGQSGVMWLLQLPLYACNHHGYRNTWHCHLSSIMQQISQSCIDVNFQNIILGTAHWNICQNIASVDSPCDWANLAVRLPFSLSCLCLTSQLNMPLLYAFNKPRTIHSCQHKHVCLVDGPLNHRF